MKTHLLDSSEPITEGLTQTAICGTEVKDAAFVFMWDEGELGWLMGLQRFQRLCVQCRKSTDKMPGRYIYGICAGEELKERQRERGAGEITQ